VGLPRLSRISRPTMSTMAVMGASRGFLVYTLGDASTARFRAGKGHLARDVDLTIV
jgi:hypothetical protein